MRIDNAVIRADTNDLAIKREQRSEYRHLDIRDGDVVLDVGGHIGLFALHALDRGAYRVHSYEPEPSNFALLDANTASHRKQISITQAAVGASAGQSLLYVSRTKDKSSHSLSEVRGRDSITVPTVSWEQVLKKTSPDIIKMDIEGGEYQLDFKLIPDEVRRIAIEFHFTSIPKVPNQTKKQTAVEGVHRIQNELRSLAFEPENLVGVTRWVWTQTITWLR